MTLDPRRQVLFNPGPVNLDPAIIENLFNVELCHRQPEFDDLVARVRARLLRHLGASDEFALAFLHGSGTLAVDAALASFVRGRVLIVDNGLYTQRLATTLMRVGGSEVSMHECGIGGAVDLDALAADVARVQPEWIGIVHHETTTGLLNPLSELTGVAQTVGSRVFVDAVSSLGAHPIDLQADVVCFNSSKCLESMPGIAGVLFRRDLAGHPTIPVLDVPAHAAGMPSTPNVQAFVALDIALDLLAAEDRPARYRRLAQHVWKTGSNDFEPYLAEPDRSHVLTAFRLGARTIDDLFARALAHDMVIYPGQVHLRDEIFRVANMGARIDEAAIDELFEVLAS
jgi:2-aminoethylphosphonate-pyruvate transaminase